MARAAPPFDALANYRLAALAFRLAERLGIPMPTQVEILGVEAADCLTLGETLTRATPILLCASGAVLAFRAGVLNIGLDGQFLMGAAAAAALPRLAAQRAEPRAAGTRPTSSGCAASRTCCPRRPIRRAPTP